MSDTDTTVILEDDYLAAAQTLQRNKRIRDELDAQDTRAKETIAKALAVGEKGISPDGEILVTVRAGSLRFDATKAAEVLDGTPLLESITVAAPDGKRAKAVLAPALYEACCTRTRDSVVAL